MPSARIPTMGFEQDFNSARRDEQEADCNHSAIMF
jgi:hypothetical protein